MMSGSILEIGVAIFFILVIIGFVTGGSHRRMRKEEEAKKERNKEDKMRLEAALEKERKKERERLIALREAHRESVVKRNEDSMKRHGSIWEAEEAAMLDYDTRFRDKWEAVGMTPPSFIKNAGHN